MKLIFTFFAGLVLMLISIPAIPQLTTDANVFGHIVSIEDNEHIPFINVVIDGTRIGTITDASGHYHLTNLPEGTHTLVVKGMGYETRSVEFQVSAGQTIEIDVEVNHTGVNLDELTVTSSPTASGYRYQPDMTLLGEELQKRSEVSFGEMLNNSPGISMRSLGAATARPVIRGMDGDRILVLENGERMGDISETSSDHIITLDPLVANRLEVVRGPASLLYGSSALGGVINLITTDIPDRWDTGSSGVLSLQGATMNNMGAGFGRYSYGDDNWAVSGRIAHRRASDITTPDGVLSGTSSENLDAALGIGFKKGSAVGGVSLSLADMSYEIPGNIATPDEGIEIFIQRQALQGRVNFSSGGFVDRKQLRFNASRMFQEEVAFQTLEDVVARAVAVEFKKHSLSSTLTMQHRPFSFFDRGAIGLNLHGHQLSVKGIQMNTPGEMRFSLGMFTFQEIPLSNTMRLQAGLRLDFQHTGALSNEQFPDADASREAFNYSGSVGFNHRPWDRLELGGQFARSHRNPSVEELYSDGAHLGAGVYGIGNIDLKDEIGQGVDIFIRWSSRVIEFEAAGFVNFFRNYIIFEPTGETDPSTGFHIFRYTGDEARLMGGELSASVSLHENVKLGLGADYVDGRRNTNGREYLPFIPPVRFMADIEYDFGFGWIGGRAVSAATQSRVAPGEEETDGYTLLGLSAGYRVNSPGRHVFILRVDNLLDERYRDHLSRIEDRNFPMPGRNFSLAYRLFF